MSAHLLADKRRTPSGSTCALPETDGGPLLRLLSANILAGGRISRYRDYVTQGLRHVLPGGRRENLDDLAQLMGDFDMVALQEADAGSMRSGYLNQTQYLAEEAGFPYWSHQPNRRVANFAQSANALLARLEPTEVLDYPLPSRIPGRGALWTRFGNDRDSLVMVVAHLSLSPGARMRQIGFLCELLRDHPNVILMGDLNCAWDSKEVKQLYARTSLSQPNDPPASFPSWRPSKAIDHILVSDALRVERRWALPHPVSDHLPVAAHIRLPAKLAQATTPPELILPDSVRAAH